MRKFFLRAFFAWSFLLLTISIAPASNSVKDEIEVAFFNVGQGNCTVIKSPDKEHILIVDAGSTKDPEDFFNVKKMIFSVDKSNMVTSISKWIGNDSYQAHFIISHFDEDHYNIISNIINNFKDDKETSNSSKLKKSSRKLPQKFRPSLNAFFESKNIKGKFDNIQFYVSQEISKHFNGKKRKEPEGSKESRKTAKIAPNLSFLKKGSINNIESIISREEQITIGGMNIDFLNNPNGIENKHSAIVKVSYAGRSVLLTGDAEKSTIGNIIDKKKIKNIDILQAPHHGADTEGSNDQAFIELTNPKSVVFSAHRYSQYDHPKHDVVKRYCTHLSKDASLLKFPHFMYDNNFVKEFNDRSEYIFDKKNRSLFNPTVSYKSKIKSGYYSIYQTKFPIFMTGSHGTIIFKWNKAGNIKKNFYSYDKANKILKRTDNIYSNFVDEFLEKLLKKELEIDGLNITDSSEFEKGGLFPLFNGYLKNLSDLNLTHSGQQNIDQNIIAAIRTELGKNSRITLQEKQLDKDFKLFERGDNVNLWSSDSESEEKEAPKDKNSIDLFRNS